MKTEWQAFRRRTDQSAGPSILVCAPLATLLAALVAGGLALTGHGPFAASGGDETGSVAAAMSLLTVLQIFTTACLLAALAGLVALSERRRLSVRLRAGAALAVKARHRAEAALARAEAADQAKARFLAMMSHELRTPLNGVAGFTEMLRGRHDLPEDARAQLDSVSRSTAGLLALVEDVLDFAHGDDGLTPETFIPAAVAADIISANHDAACAKGLILTLDDCLPPGLGVYLDRRRLRRALRCLVSNAVKFTPTGQVVIRLSRSGDHLVVSVADTGPGLPEAQRPALFEAFVQGYDSRVRAHEGAGMGLAVVGCQVQRLGGRIDIDSPPGGGAVFTLTLPARWREADRPFEASGPAPDEVPDDGRAPRVLVVDDHPVNREVARLMLTALGCEVLEANDGAQAVEAARDGVFDLIMMDIRMPIMDGLEATRRIRSLEGPASATPIVAMTADAMPEDVIRSRAAGMDDHLAKPISQASVTDVVIRALETVSARAAA